MENSADRLDTRADGVDSAAEQSREDAAAYAQYGKGMSKDDWRRNNVNVLIEHLSAAIKYRLYHFCYLFRVIRVITIQKNDDIRAGGFRFGGCIGYSL